MTHGKTLLIGLDGGTYTILEPFAREGIIPNLARLMRDGARGVLRSTVPPISAPAWATFQTGKNPGKHGLFNFFDLSEHGYRQSHDFRTSRVVNHGNIGSATIYDYLREAGRRVISVNIPLTYPTPEVEGALVACWLTPPGSKAFTWPRSIADELPDYRIDQDFGEGMYAVTPNGRELDSDFLFDDLTEIMNRRADATRHLMTSREWDVCMVCFTETDRVHHYFWRAINPDYPAYATDKVAHERDRFKAFYRELDAQVGRLMEAAGEGTTTFVISDHGFDKPPARRYNVIHWMQEQGWLRTRDARQPAPSANAPSGAPSAPANAPRPGGLARGVRQAGRALWKRLVPPSLREQVYARVGYSPAPETVDWERTRAWSFGVNNNLGAICINERDGSGQGCVAPGPAVDKLPEELAACPRGLRDPETGRPVVERVARREEVFTGPFTARFPHLLFWLDPAYEADHESGFAISSLRVSPGEAYPNGRGNHRPEGICIARGPAIRPGDKPEHDLASIMPTVLHLAAVAVPEDVDGRVMDDYLTDEARALAAGGPASTGAEHRFAAPTQEDVAALHKKLEELGYM